MKKSLIKNMIWLGVASAALSPEARAANERSRARDACRPAESWSFGGAIGDDWRHEFQEFAGGRRPPVQGFGEALALRRAGRDPEERAFAEYWTSLALYRAGLLHLAWSGFSAVAGRAPKAESVGVQSAALECLTVIQQRVPTLELPEGVVAQLPKYERGPVLARAALVELRKRVAKGRPAAEVREMLKLTENGGAYQQLARVWTAAHLGDHDDTIAQARAFVALAGLPEELDRYRDTAHLLLSRALYSRGKFAESAEAMKLVRKSSNELARSLSDLAWAQLRADQYSEAVGTAINLQSGGLRKTFTPEAPMVMAMAFNEMCHYPESLQAVQYFRGSYEDSYKWLQAWKERPDASLYAKVTAFLRRDPATPIPAKVGSEWMRSPHFIARQDEIKLYFDSEQAGRKAGQAAAQLQRQMALALLETVRDLKPRYDRVKSQLEAGAPLPTALAQDIDKLKKAVTHYRRLRRAAGPWRQMASFQAKRAVADKKRLVKEIDNELATLNLRMLMQLDEIAENLHFLEVEIFQGATQDIIWQNAHPDYKQIVVTLKDTERRAEAAKSWNWGSVQGGLAGTHEIWEDELGSFKADLFDNCSSKDKYLQIKGRVGRAR